MAGGGSDIAYYTLPVILSFDGVERQANQKLGKVFKSSGANASKELAAGFKSSQADIDKAAASYDKLKNKAADALGKIRTEEAALQRLRNVGASDDRIIKQEERLASARRNSITISRDAEKGHASLKRAQDALGDGSDNLGKKMGGLGGKAAIAGDALAAAGVVAAGAAVVGIAALAAGVVVAGRELYNLGEAFDDTFDNIRIKTGATGKDLEALQKATERLSTVVPLSIADIGNVVAETSRSLHLTGKDLDAVSGSIANLGRLTGENVDVRTLGKAFRGFGVDAKDQVPALDSLFRANQATGVGVNELLATIVKGGAGLRQFGFSFGESAAIATQFEEAGLDSTKALAGFTKGLATLAKDGQTGQQALRDNVTQIKALTAAGQDAQALDLTNKLFGAKGGAQFFEAIKNGALDLDTLASSLDGTGDSISNAAADTDDWSERWTIFKNTAAVALEPLATGTFDAVNTGLTELADYVTDHKDDIIDFFVTLADGAITGAELTIKATGDIAKNLGEIIAPIGDVLGAVDDFQAWQAEIRGDDETAAQLRAQAQEMYGLGDGLKNFGDAARLLDLDRLRDGLHEIGEKAKEGGDDVLHLKGAVGQLAGVGIDVPVKIDTAPADVEMRKFFNQWQGAVLGLQTPNLPPQAVTPPPNAGGLILPGQPRAAGGAISGPGGPTSDVIPLWASDGEHMWTADEVNAVGGQGAMYRMRSAVRSGAMGKFAGGGAVGGVSAGASELKSIIESQYPVTANADVGRQDSYGEHSSGNALDIMLGSDYKSADKVGMGNSIAQFLLNNAGLMDLKWVIWNDKIYKPGQPPEVYGNPSSGDDNSQHRNHVHAFLAGKGVKAPSFDASQLLGSTTYSGRSSGGSSAGLGPNGEQGTWEAPDEKAVREADQKVNDADFKVRQAELKLKELDADAKESQKQAALKDVEDAKREAADARTDAATTKQGKFTAGGKGAAGKSGGPQLSELGGIAKSFLTETFGLDGSWLPDIGNLAPLQMADTLLSALVPQFSGAGTGGGAPGAQTSSGAFGMPEIPAPGMPEGANHLGPNAGGLPGPTVINADMSANFAGNVGQSWDEIRKQQEQTQQRGLARITGIPLAVGS